jgi:hypothetical protein
LSERPDKTLGASLVPIAHTNNGNLREDKNKQGGNQEEIKKLTMRGSSRSYLQMSVSFKANFVVRFEKVPRGTRRLALATVVAPTPEITGKVPNNAIRASNAKLWINQIQLRRNKEIK